MLNTVLATFSEGAPPIPPTSYESIAKVNGDGSSTTITFSSIPSTYKHLQIRSMASDVYSGVQGSASITVQYNGDTGSNYTRHHLYGNGTTAYAEGAGNLSSGAILAGMTYGTATNVYGTSIVDIIDYASTTKYKTTRNFSGADRNASDSTYYIALSSFLWMSTSAITSITLTSGNAAFTTSSSFALYGIKG